MAKMKEIFLCRNAFSNRKISFGIQIEIPDATVVEIVLTLRFGAKNRKYFAQKEKHVQVFVAFCRPAGINEISFVIVENNKKSMSAI